MVILQNLKTTQGVSEEVSGFRNNVQGGVEGANNKLDVILHGAHLFYSITDTLLISFRLRRFKYRFK